MRARSNSASAARMNPAFVVVDALRTFWPSAEAKNDDAANMLSIAIFAVRAYCVSAMEHR